MEKRKTFKKEDYFTYNILFSTIDIMVFSGLGLIITTIFKAIRITLSVMTGICFFYVSIFMVIR